MSDGRAPPDSEETLRLLQRIRGGDRQAFEPLFAPHRGELRRFVEARLDAKLRARINGALDHVKSLIQPTAANDWVSAAVVLKGEYGVPQGLVCGCACRHEGRGVFNVVPGLQLDPFGKQKLQATLQELLDEKEAVKELLPA